MAEEKRFLSEDELGQLELVYDEDARWMELGLVRPAGQDFRGLPKYEQISSVQLGAQYGYILYSYDILRRLVLCWNYCRGLTHEQLERGRE